MKREQTRVQKGYILFIQNVFNNMNRERNIRIHKQKGITTKESKWNTKIFKPLTKQSFKCPLSIRTSRGKNLKKTHGDE